MLYYVNRACTPRANAKTENSCASNVFSCFLIAMELDVQGFLHVPVVLALQFVTMSW